LQSELFRPGAWLQQIVLNECSQKYEFKIIFIATNIAVNIDTAYASLGMFLTSLDAEIYTWKIVLVKIYVTPSMERCLIDFSTLKTIAQVHL